MLPEEFTNYTRRLMGNERFQRYMNSFSEDVPVSIRLNPMKTKNGGWNVVSGEQVPWCPEGYYLPQRPQFTMDPLFHAGCYYVQEAGSMFISHVLRQYLTNTPVTMLDLCAAPGGKSTAAITALPAGSTLYSNEPIRQRANILAENIAKWNYPNCIVTNNYPSAYRDSKLCFDVILCDVPCSGEGMFRRDEATIGEWSPQQIEKCWPLQRQIVAEAWPCLRPDGLLIYSTCTFNTQENEENVRWICEELGAEVLPVNAQPEWHITGSLLPGFDQPVYGFIPGITRSEGLFVAVLKKSNYSLSQKPSTVREKKKDKSKISPLKIIESPTLLGEDGSEQLTYQQAMNYLRGEALTLSPATPRGAITVCFMNIPLGMVKNIGTRANNLYPKEWRIKTTHIPAEHEAILRHS